MRPRHLILASLLLSSCGGGGGSSSSSGPVVVVPGGSATPAPSPAPTATPTPTAGTLDGSTLATEPGAIQISFAAADVPARAAPYIIGVGTHFSYAADAGYDPATSAAKLAESGIQSFRDDLFWNAFAPSWDLQGSYLPDAMTAFMTKSSARPLMIVNNGNPAIIGTQPPVTDAGRNAFADFAVRAVAATRGRGAIYEIWNEWNMTATKVEPRLTGAGTAGDYRASSYYAPLAVKTVSAIKAAYPGTPVLVGASGDDDGWLWTSDVVARGALRQADGLSVHLYNQCESIGRRTATAMVDRLTSLRDAATSANGGVQPSIYVTEWGWPTGQAQCSISDNALSVNVPQFLLHSAALPWIKGSWMYELKNSGNDATDIQDNFGLYDANYKPKAGQCGFADAAKIVADAKAMAVQTVGSSLTVIRVVTPRGLAVLAWSTDGTKSGRITVGGTAPYVARRMCQPTDTIGTGRSVVIGQMPVLIDVPDVARLAINVTVVS